MFIRVHPWFQNSNDVFLKNRKTTLDKKLLTVIIMAVFISNMLINMIM